MANLKLPPVMLPVTTEQAKWLKSNKEWQRMSHAHGVRFYRRGTLWPDGRFVAEGPGTPVMDGNGAFGVGVAVAAPLRR